MTTDLWCCRLDHLEKTKGFKLNSLKYLVIDEADRLLDMDFGPVLDTLLKFLPRESTYTGDSIFKFTSFRLVV